MKNKQMREKGAFGIRPVKQIIEIKTSNFLSGSIVLLNENVI